MTMLRRVLAIVTRSFYHSKHRYTKSLNKHHYKGATLYSSSSRLTHHQSRASSSTSKVITVERHKAATSSYRKQLIYIAAITTLSYIGYKYYLYDDKEEKEDTKNVLFTTVQKLIENNIIHRNMAFKMGVFMDGRKRYNNALYFYKLYLKRANTKKGEYAALNNMIIIYYRLNEYENALIAFELIGKQQTKQRNLEFIKAHCHHSLKQYNEAITHYLLYLNNPLSLQDKKSDVTAAYNNLALLYYEIGQYNKAYQYFVKLGRNQIRDKKYSFRVAHCLQSMNEFEKSLQYYNEYLSDDDTESINLQNTYHNLGVLFYDNNKNDEALKMFKKLNDEELEKRNLEFKFAHIYAKIGDRKNAIKYLKKCSEKEKIYGEYAIVCKGLTAQILYEDGEYKKAIEEYDILGEKEIIKQDLFFGAAYSYFKCGEYDKALKYYRLLIQNKKHKMNEDEIAFVYCRIALVFYKMNDYIQCLKVFEDELSEEDIKQWNMEFIIAHSNHKLAKYDEAKDYYLQFLSNKRSDTADIINCYHNLALLYYDLNLFAESIEYFNLLKEKEIINRNLEFFAGHCYQEMGNDDECIKYYKQCLDKYDDNDNVYHNLGSVYYKMGQFEDAIDLFSKLTDSEIVKRGLSFSLSKCYGAIGDLDSERKYLKFSDDKEKKEKIEMALMYYHLFDNEMAIKMFSSVNDYDISCSNAEFVAAHCYQLIGDHISAIKYYKLGFENDNNLVDIDGVNKAYHNMGCAYHDIAQYQNAIECFDELNDDHIKQTNIEFIIAVSYHNLNQKDNALKYYLLFLSNPTTQTQNDKESIVSCYNNMVMLYYYHFNDYESAWNYLHKMEHQQIIAKNLEFEIANCAQKLNKNNESVKYYKLFIKNTHKNQLNDDAINNVYQNMAQIYEKDQNLDQKRFKEFDQQSDKHKKLKLFVEWIRNE